MAHACNPSTLGGRGGWITRSRDWGHPGQHGETPSLLKIQKISWAWWRVPVIPGTQEAEVGELPEPRRWTLRWAEIAPLHSSLGNKSETLSQKKKSMRIKTHLQINENKVSYHQIVPKSHPKDCSLRQNELFQMEDKQGNGHSESPAKSKQNVHRI